MRRHLLRDDAGKEIEVTVERPGNAAGDDLVEITVGGRTTPYAVVRAGAGGGLLRRGDDVVAYRAVRRGHAVEIWSRGRSHRLEVVTRTARRAADAEAAGASAELTAPMPGRVLAIRIRAGDLFAAHEPLVVMESMKMELTLSAPKAGRVAELRCAEGDLVELGAVLARLVPRDGDETGEGASAP